MGQEEWSVLYGSVEGCVVGCVVGKHHWSQVVFPIQGGVLYVGRQIHYDCFDCHLGPAVALEMVGRGSGMGDYAEQEKILVSFGCNYFHWSVMISNGAPKRQIHFSEVANTKVANTTLFGRETNLAYLVKVLVMQRM